jgi:hypothetical protein
MYTAYILELRFLKLKSIEGGGSEDVKAVS